MGEKDYQQLYLVKKFIEKKYKQNYWCKTIRNKNKLRSIIKKFFVK